MIIVGELINASRQAVAQAIEARDRPAIEDLARVQADKGVDYIDVNAGVFLEKEAVYLKWLVETVQGVVDKPCCIDSPSPKAIEAALSVHQGAAMINSISLENKRYQDLLPIVADSDLKVVALCLSDAGMPKTAAERLPIAEDLVSGLMAKNVPLDHIYIDPLVQPVSADHSFGHEFLSSLEEIDRLFPGIHFMSGLSNISYGLPERKLLNQTFMCLAISKGLDGAIVNPLDDRLMAVVVTAETLMGKDEYCLKYIQAFREKKFVFQSRFD